MLKIVVNPWVLVLALPALLIVLWVFQLIYIPLRMRKSAGVKAPILYGNPFGGNNCSLGL